MNLIEKKILSELMQNSRITITKIAKKVNVSREVANYKINKLVKNKVILKFVTEINTKQLGFIGSAVFINIKASKEKEFEEYLSKCGFVSWVAKLSGVWSFGLSIYGTDNEDIDNKFEQIQTEFKDSIINYRFNLHRKNHYFYERYFEEEPKKETSKCHFNKKKYLYVIQLRHEISILLVNHM